MADPNDHQTAVLVKAVVLDPEDGESAITEVYSGRVLRRFQSLRLAAAELRWHRPDYEARALGMTGDEIDNLKFVEERAAEREHENGT